MCILSGDLYSSRLKLRLFKYFGLTLNLAACCWAVGLGLFPDRICLISVQLGSVRHDSGPFVRLK